MSQFWYFIKKLNNQAKRTQLAIAAVTVLVGILIVTQLRAHQTAAQVLQAATEDDLGKIVSDLNNEVNTLRAETADLRLQLFQIERANHDSSTIMKESSKTLNNLKVIAGLTKVSGPGIKIRLTDRNSLLASNDLVDIITELRGGGAEAISLNGIRIVARTGIMQDKRGIFIDQRQVSSPYEIMAIGSPKMLFDALTINGGVKDKLSSLSGVAFDIAEDNDLRIDSVAFRR